MDKDKLYLLRRTSSPEVCGLLDRQPTNTKTDYQLLQKVLIKEFDLVHPVYVSTLNTYPLLIGKYLLNRFEPLIDFKHLKIWTQVHELLPCQSLDSNKLQCQVTDIAPKSLIDDAVAKPASLSVPGRQLYGPRHPRSQSHSPGMAHQPDVP